MSRKVPTCRPVAPISTRLFLEELEIPDCDCEFSYIEIRRCHCGFGEGCERCPKVCKIVSPICPHIEDADHDTSVLMWAMLLEEEFPEKYADPPLPPLEEEDALTRQARIEVYEERAACDAKGRQTAESVSLFHPADLWRFRGDVDGGQALKVTMVSEREETKKGRRMKRRGMMRNGRINPTQTLTTGATREDSDMLTFDDQDRGAGNREQHQQGSGELPRDAP